MKNGVNDLETKFGFLCICLTMLFIMTGCGGLVGRYPSQSEKGKCTLRYDKENDTLYCERLDGCTGDCILYSVPRGKPKAEPTREDQPAKPEANKYYFCRCLVTGDGGSAQKADRN